MSAPRHAYLDATAMSLMVLLCALWGLQQVAVKTALPGISPIFQAALRSAGAGLLLWGWSAWKGVPLFDRDRTFWPGVIAGLLFAGEFMFIYWGLTYTTASRCILFVYTSPFVVAVGAHLLIPGEKLKPIQVIGLICAFAGVAIAFADGLRLPTRNELIGDGMALLAAFFWGATTLVIKTTNLARISASKTLFYQLAVSAVALPPVALALGEPGIIAITPMIGLSLFYQTVIVAFVSFLAWFWLINHYPAGRLASFSFLAPLFGLIAGGLLLGERISLLLVLAMALVATGIYLANRR